MINLKTVLKKYGLLFTVFIVYGIFALLEPRFTSVNNFFNILNQASVLGMLSISVTFVIVTGEMDLSFAATATTSAVCLILLVSGGVSLFLSLLIVMVISVVIGFVKAGFISYTRVPSLLGTICLWLILKGINATVTQGEMVWSGSYPAGFEFFGRYRLFGVIPIPVITFFIITIIGGIFLEHSLIGRYFYATGGNSVAADHAGIKTKRIKALAFIICGFISGIAGITMASMYGSANPTVGNPQLFPAVIAAFLGATFLKEGQPNLWGTFVATLLLAIITNGFNILGVMYWWRLIAQGLIMVFAVVSLILTSNSELEGMSM